MSEPDDDALYAIYRGHEYCEDGLRAVYNSGRESLTMKLEALEQECAQLREELASIDVTVSKSPSSRPPRGGE